MKLPFITKQFWKSPACFPLTLLGLSLFGVLVVTLIIVQQKINPGLSIALFTFLILAFVFLAWLFSRIQVQLITPLSQLKIWAKEINQGILGARLPEYLPGEFNALAQNINSLGERIETLTLDMQNQVKQQTKHIERKTHSLEIIYDVAASINVSRDLEDLLTRFLHTLKDVVKAKAAVVRLVTDDNQMRLVSSIGLDEDLMQRERLIPSEQCLCGSAYRNGHVLFQKDVHQCDKIIGRAFFDSDNISMIAVPLKYRDKTLGVYNLFVDNDNFSEPEDIEELLTSIGQHLGMAIDKARSDDESNRLAIMEERTRLAHELHDSLAQTLASLRFQVRVLDEKIRLGEEPSIWFELEKIENNLDEAYGELRELITHFRAPIDKRGLVPAVEHLVERFRNQTDISIFLQKEWHVLQLSPTIEVQALRIIQEALNNIRKHSQAHAVRVIMRSDVQGKCSILIEDDGVGMHVPPPSDHISGDHLGLNIMDERAQRIGGSFKIESEPSEGTRVTLEFNQHSITASNNDSSSVRVTPSNMKVL